MKNEFISSLVPTIIKNYVCKSLLDMWHCSGFKQVVQHSFLFSCTQWTVQFWTVFFGIEQIFSRQSRAKPIYSKTTNIWELEITCTQRLINITVAWKDFHVHKVNMIIIKEWLRTKQGKIIRDYKEAWSTDVNWNMKLLSCKENCKGELVPWESAKVISVMQFLLFLTVLFTLISMIWRCVFFTYLVC